MATFTLLYFTSSVLTTCNPMLTLPATVSVSETMYERCSMKTSSSSSTSFDDVRGDKASVVGDAGCLLLSIIATSAL